MAGGKRNKRKAKGGGGGAGPGVGAAKADNPLVAAAGAEGKQRPSTPDAAAAVSVSGDDLDVSITRPFVKDLIQLDVSAAHEQAPSATVSPRPVGPEGKKEQHLKADAAIGVPPSTPPAFCEDHAIEGQGSGTGTAPATPAATEAPAAPTATEQNPKKSKKTKKESAAAALAAAKAALEAALKEAEEADDEDEDGEDEEGEEKHEDQQDKIGHVEVVLRGEEDTIKEVVVDPVQAKMEEASAWQRRAQASSNSPQRPSRKSPKPEQPKEEEEEDEAASPEEEMSLLDETADRVEETQEAVPFTTTEGGTDSISSGRAPRDPSPDMVTPGNCLSLSGMRARAAAKKKAADAIAAASLAAKLKSDGVGNRKGARKEEEEGVQGPSSNKRKKEKQQQPKLSAKEAKALAIADAKARAEANSVRDKATKGTIWEEVLSGSLSGVKRTIEAGTNPNETDEQGRTPLMIACALGFENIVSHLIRPNLTPSGGARLEAKAIEGWTPLMVACGGGHLNAVKDLIQAGADVSARDSEFGSTPLMWACGGGHVEVIKFLVHGPCAAPEHVLAKNDDYWTALMVCADGGFTECCKLLVKAGASSCDFGADGQTALDLAGRANEHICVRYLASLAAPSSADFWGAVEDGDTERVLEWLATNGHLVHVVNDEGRTPLLVTCLAGHLDLANCLLQAGAKVDFQDPSGTCPIDVAVVLGRLDLVKSLVQQGGADLEVANQKGWTPLMQAVMTSDLDIIRFLVDSCARVNASNSDGSTVLDIAEMAGKSHVVEYLETKGGFSSIDVRKQISAVEEGKRGLFKLW